MSRIRLRIPSRPWTVWTAIALTAAYLGWRLSHAVVHLARQVQREDCVYWGVVEGDCYHDDRFAWLWMSSNLLAVLWCAVAAFLVWRGFTFAQIILLVSCVFLLGAHVLTLAAGFLRHASTFAGALALAGIVVLLVLPPTFRWLRECDQVRGERRAARSRDGLPPP